MSEADFKEVAEIDKKVFSVSWSEKSFRDAALSPENLYLVCLQDDKIAGYCGMWGSFGDGNITNVCVKEEYRNQGVGYEMLSELMNIGINEYKIEVFYLEVRQSNDSAKHLYEKLGFRSIGVRKNFYEKPVEDANIMSKIIKKDS